MNTILTRHYVETLVRSRLGGSQVEIEFTQTDLDAALALATHKLNEWTPRISTNNVTLGADGNAKIDIDIPNFQSVLSMDFSRPTLMVNHHSTSDPFLLQRSLVSGMGDATDFEASNQFIDDTSIMFGTTPSYRLETTQSGVQTLYVSARSGMSVSYRYMWGMSPEWVAGPADLPPYGTYGIRHLDNSEISWFVDFVTVCIQKVVARALRKFGGVITTDGGADPTDGDTLMSEAISREQELLETIRRRQIRLHPTFF